MVRSIKRRKGALAEDDEQSTYQVLSRLCVKIHTLLVTLWEFYVPQGHHLESMGAIRDLRVVGEPWEPMGASGILGSTWTPLGAHGSPCVPSELSSFILISRLMMTTCSRAKLTRIFGELRAAPEVIHATAHTLGFVAYTSFNHLRVVEDVAMPDGTTFKWEYADPGLLLSKLVADGPGMRSLFEAVLPSDVSEVHWRCVVAFDEFTAGNVLKCHNDRKTMVVSFTFLELGQVAITREVAWTTPVCVRHTAIEQIEGAWSCMFRLFMHRLILGPCGLATAGVPLQLSDRTVMLRASIHNIMSDGEGLKMAFDWKGASSLKPCFSCSNVWKRGSDIANRKAGHVEIGCTTPSSLRSFTHQELDNNVDLLLESQRRVHAGLCTKCRHENLELVIGINPNPTGFIADAVLRQHVRPLAVFTYDWVHNVLQDGTLTVEMWQFLNALSQIGVTNQTLKAYLSSSDWQFPRHSSGKSKALHHIFSGSRWSSSNEAGKLKAGASELLSLFGLVRHFAETRLQDMDDLRAELKSFFAACKVLELLLQCKRCMADPLAASASLQSAISLHLALNQQAYGGDGIKPKHHWQMHIPKQIARDGLVLDAFVIERKHLSIKRVAEPITNTTVFEHSLMSAVVHSQIQAAKIDKLDRLSGKTRQMGSITLAPHLLCQTLQVLQQ